MGIRSGYENSIVVVDTTAETLDWRGDRRLPLAYEAALGRILPGRFFDLVMMTPHEAGQKLTSLVDQIKNPLLVIVHQPEAKNYAGSTGFGRVVQKWLEDRYYEASQSGAANPPPFILPFDLAPAGERLPAVLSSEAFADAVRAAILAPRRSPASKPVAARPVCQA